LPGCQDAESGKTRLLFGYEGRWCHFQGKADPGDRDNVMVACREAAEETCFAIGAPRSLKVNYFDAGNAKSMFGGAWLIDMGILDEAEQQAIVDRHHANLHGALWRKPTRCESEMSKLQWVEAEEVLAAIEAYRPGEKSISVPSLGGRFRSWTVEFYVPMAKRQWFKEYCLRKGEPQPRHDGKPTASEATMVKVSREDEVKVLEKMLQAAKYKGGNDETWEAIFSHLQKAPSLVNSRNGRSYGLLHHAAYWGQQDATLRLLAELHADSTMISKDGQTPAQVARSYGENDLAALIEGWS
jgi:8-oxo-dGTP pyrophosphatase MutT (NUDIX family)